MRNLFLTVALGATSMVFAGCGPSMLGADGGISGGGGSSGTGTGGTTGGTASCGTVAPCGGNIVGEWNIIDSCFQFASGNPLGAFCPTGTTDASGLNMTGSASYRADGTYSVMYTLSGSFVMHLPPACLVMSGITITCAQLDAAVKMGQAEDPDPSIQSISCATASSGCDCTAQMTPETSTASGTYVTQGTQLTENGEDPNGYCVQGQDLHISSASMGSTVSGSVVLRRR